MINDDCTQYIDLHLHSDYSDGMLSPKQIVKAAKLRRLDVIALTDHDSIDGYEQARTAAEEWGITLMPGVEFTTQKYHILGLGFDVNNNRIHDLFNKSRELQDELTRKRVEALQKGGIPITFEKVRETFPNIRLGKYNLFMSMVNDKKVRDFIEAGREELSPKELMNFYLSSNDGNNPFYVANDCGLSDREVIGGIKQANGISIIGHPVKQVKDFSELDRLRELGLDGIEIQLNDSKHDYLAFEKYAERYNMLISYGSDYHGPDIERQMLSRGRNIASIPLRNKLEQYFW